MCYLSGVTMAIESKKSTTCAMNFGCLVITDTISLQRDITWLTGVLWHENRKVEEEGNCERKKRKSKGEMKKENKTESKQEFRHRHALDTHKILLDNHVALYEFTELPVNALYKQSVMEICVIPIQCSKQCRHPVATDTKKNLFIDQWQTVH